MGIDQAGRAYNHPNATKGYIVTVNGVPLTPELSAALTGLTIEQEINQPAMFIMRFEVANTESALAVGTVSNIFFNRLKPGYTVSITLSGEIGVQPILVGFITAIEPEFSDETFVEVRGFDNMHRMRFGTQNRSFQMVRDSDLVTLVAGEAGVPAVATPTTTLHKYVLQNNQSNYEFLLERACRLGWEMVMEGPAMQFRPPEQVPNVEALNALLSYSDNRRQFGGIGRIGRSGRDRAGRSHRGLPRFIHFDSRRTGRDDPRSRRDRQRPAGRSHSQFYHRARRSFGQSTGAARQVRAHR
jgi:hypothetical protein